MAGLNFFIPLILIPIASNNPHTTSIGLDVCLGEHYQSTLVESNEQIWLSGSSLLEVAWSWSWTLLIFLCMSNIPDFYFIYSCFKEVKRSDENVKNMMSDQAYLRRKRYEP